MSTALLVLGGWVAAAAMAAPFLIRALERASAAQLEPQPEDDSEAAQ
jgi:hypothetical protein